MRDPKTYFVYIMTNRSKTLYTGLTNSLVRRVRQHKLGIGSGFTTKYRLDRLGYYERFQDVHNAIEREKEIKGWLRIKKIALIVSVNPEWRDLSLEWYERHPFQPQAKVRQTASASLAVTPKSCHPERSEQPALSLSKGPMHSPAGCTGRSPQRARIRMTKAWWGPG